MSDVTETNKRDSWNWVRWMHLGVCALLVALVVMMFTVSAFGTLDRVGFTVVAVIFIGQHVLITAVKRWNRFDDV